MRLRAAQETGGRRPLCTPARRTDSSRSAALLDRPVSPLVPCPPQQVKDWIAAWNSGSEGSEGRPTELEFPAPSAAPTTRVTEPSLPSSAAALLSAMTADAPVGATPRGEEGPAAGSPSVEEQVLSAVAAAAPTSEPSGDASAAEKEAEYKARISAGGC